MAYVSQELKAKVAPVVKAILKKYGVKGSLAVKNHSTLVLNIKSGSMDFISNYNETMEHQPKSEYWKPAENSLSVNQYWFHEHFTGRCLDFLNEIMDAMNDGNWDKSDIQSDYFNVGWYVDINVGQWNKPYITE